MDKEGMVAVVRGMRNSGLCVTLLDGARQYTLQPNTVTQPYHTTNQASQAAAPNQYAVNTAAQAVDGRYASVYKTVHCNMVPTSPTMDVSEFPPQRVALSKGHGNFEVGGLGSGETTYHPSRVTDSFRGGLSWPERGSVFSPRPSVEPDPFADSLRKYPSMSAERSTEMVERLINYAQFKNLKTQKLQSLRSESPIRPRKTLEDDIRTDESPTRERSRRYEECPLTDRYERSRRDDDRYRKYDEGDRRFERNYDVRNFRDISRRGRESVRSPTHPLCPTIKEKSIHFSPEEKREPFNVQISIDTQVDFPIISSKEVATVPKMIPSVRNVAIAMSPLPSIVSLSTDTKTSKSVQTLKTQENKLLPRKSVQTCFSSIDITNKKIKNGRKSKSQEALRDNEAEDEVLHLVQDLGLEERGLLLDDLVKKLKKIYKTDKNDRIKIKFGRCVREQLFSEMDLKDFTRELSNQLLSKIKKNNGLRCNSTNLYRAEIQSHGDNNSENCVDDIINEWLRDLPIKNRDYLGKNIKKDHLLLTIANKIKSIIATKLKLNGIDKSFQTEIIKLIEDIPIAVSGCDKMLYLNRLVTDLVRRIKGTVRNYKAETDNTHYVNGASAFNDSATKEEVIKNYIREELNNFVRKFELRICLESMDELEFELTNIVLDAMVAIRTGKEEKVKKKILFTLLNLLNITEYQANYFANNMILTMKTFYNDVPKIKPQTFIVLNTQTQTRDINARETIDENFIKANLLWYTNQIIQQINEWVSSIKYLDPNNNFTKVAIHDLAGDIVDKHKYLQLNPTTKVSKIDEIEHLKYQIFKSINKLVGDDNFETIEKAPELMERIKNVPVPILIKPQNNIEGYRQMGFDYCNRLCNDSKRPNMAFDHGEGFRRSNITVAIGSVTRSKTLPSDTDEPNTTNRTSDPTENRQPCCSTRNDRPQINSNMPAKQKTQEQIIEEFDEFLKEWVQRIPISEKPELIEKCRLGIYNGVWKAISKIKMNPEALDNPHFYKDVLDDEIEELLNCLTQTPELKKQRNTLKAEVIEKAADIYKNVASAALNTSYRQQIVENIANNLPRIDNRVDHTGQDVNKLYEEVMKLYLAEYFILYTKYQEDDAIKANVFKRKLLKEVHELVNGIKETHGKEFREIEIKQYVQGVVNALQKVPVPNNETVKLETDEIILALEVEQWFSDLPLMPNEELMDVLSRRKYRDILAKKLFDLENSNEGDNEEKMKEEIAKFLKRMPFIPGQTENIPLMVKELMDRLKSRPKYDADDDNKNAVDFREPHGYEAFSRDMPLCSSYTEDQKGSSFMIVGGERAPDRSMAYGGQYVQGRNDDSLLEWRSIGQNSAMKGSQGADPCCGRPTCSQYISPPPQSAPNSQQEWLSLEKSADPGAMKGSPQGAGPCCGRPTCSQSTSLPPLRGPNSQPEQISLGHNSAQGATTGFPEGAGPCCGRPTCSKSTPLPPQSTPNTQREWLPLGQSSFQGAMRGPPQGSRSYGRTTRSQSISPSPLSQPDWRSLEQSNAPSAMRDTSLNPQGSSDSCCKRATCLSQISTQSQTHSSHRILDGTVASREQSPEKLSKVQSKTANVSRRRSPSADSNISRAQSPGNKSESVTSKAKSKKSKNPPKVSCECFDTPKASKGKSPSDGKASRGKSPTSDSSDKESRSVTSKTKLTKTKSPIKGESGNFKTASTSKISKSARAGKASRRQSPVGDSSDEESRSVTSKTKLTKTKSSIKRESSKINKSHVFGKASRCQSSASGPSDEELKPVKSKSKPKKAKLPPKVVCDCSRTPKFNKRSPNTTQAYSGEPDSTRPVAGCSNEFPEEISGRPAGYSTPNQGVPTPNMCRVKKRNRDIEQERREAATRRIEMEDSDDSDRDDVRCRCMERIWKWKQRQCRPCDDYPDFRYPFPLPYPFPPHCFNGYF